MSPITLPVAPPGAMTLGRGVQCNHSGPVPDLKGRISALNAKDDSVAGFGFAFVSFWFLSALDQIQGTPFRSKYRS